MVSEVRPQGLAYPPCSDASTIWLEGLEVVDADWAVRASVSDYRSGGVRRQELIEPEIVCWPHGNRHHFGGRPFSRWGERGDWWWPVEAAIRFALTDFVVSDAAPDQVLTGVHETLNNRLLQLQINGLTMLVPALTVLSAVALPNVVVMRALLSPGEFGFTVESPSRRPGTLSIHNSPWAKLPKHVTRRTLECLAYWLEEDSRRDALSVVFHSVFERRPVEIPRTADILTFDAVGYRRGREVMIEKLGRRPGQPIWPRNWTECELRDIRGRLLKTIA